MKCLLCEESKVIELKNLGLINSKWVYKGILNGQKTNVFEGDGITIDNQLYIMQEAKVYNLIYKLYIEVKPYFAKEDNTGREKTEINKEENDNFDLDDISLNLPEDKKNRNPSENEMLLLSNVHGAKLINNDEDVQNFDVIIDGNEKNICEDCMNNNDCFIF